MLSALFLMLYSWKFALKANTKIKPRIAAQSAETSGLLCLLHVLLTTLWPMLQLPPKALFFLTCFQLRQVPQSILWCSMTNHMSTVHKRIKVFLSFHTTLCTVFSYKLQKLFFKERKNKNTPRKPFQSEEKQRRKV